MVFFSFRSFMKNFFDRFLFQPEARLEPAHQTAQQNNLRVDAGAQELSDGKELLSLVAEAAPDMLLLCDISSRACAYVNRQVAVALGFSRKEIEAMGLSLFETLLHPEDRASFSDNWGSLAGLGDGDVCEAEYRFRHVDGAWLWFHCRATVFSRDGNGLPRQILCAARDITERRKYEEAIREGEVLEARNRLAARVAHDINNPLANIKNSLFLLRNALLPDHPDAKYLRWSEEEVDRIAQVVRRLSTASPVDG